MVKYHLLDTELWVCNTAQAKVLWNKHPADRWRIWHHDEVSAYLLASPEEISAAIQQKRAKPGKLKIAERSDIPAEELPNYCAERRVWCSERQACEWAACAAECPISL